MPKTLAEATSALLAATDAFNRDRFWGRVVAVLLAVGMVISLFAGWTAWSVAYANRDIATERSCDIRNAFIDVLLIAGEGSDDRAEFDAFVESVRLALTPEGGCE